MSRLGVVLQESVSREREATRTILCFLSEQMDVADEASSRRRSLKERLGFKGIGCCGAAWGFGPTTAAIIDDEEEEGENAEEERHVTADPAPVCSDPNPDPIPDPEASPGMNLAAALAAERRLRASSEEAGGSVATPRRVSLMRLLEETEGGDEKEKEKERSDWVCCVCMGRKKGAAFIPCGHTFCRVCSRELWLNRGSCPLCNRPILEILDIF